MVKLSRGSPAEITRNPCLSEVPMPKAKLYRIAEIVRRSGTSVRTLHHYDHIGLLVPSRRSSSGYRLYSERDLSRLQRILAWRELGFGLGEIATLLEQRTPHRALLEKRRTQLHNDRQRLSAILATLERYLALDDQALATRVSMGPEALQTNNQQEKPMEPTEDPYIEETAARWGKTTAYQTAHSRTRRYDQADWEAIHKEMESIEADFADAMAKGIATDAPRTVAIAYAHRVHIDRWFYPCDAAMHVMLAETYETDARFASHYDDRAPGLARYVAAAVRAAAA